MSAQFRCPLCHLEAECQVSLAHKLKHFTCEGCTQFVIKDRAESLLKDTPAQIRGKFSEHAKSAPKGTVLFICPDPNQPQGVTTKYLPLHEALQQ